MSRDNRYRLINWTVAALLIGVIVLYTLYLIRGALLVIYVSALLAVGFIPAVSWIERQKLIGHGRLPRWAAILVLYFGVLAVFALLLVLIVPPLVDQASALWRELPTLTARFDRTLARYRIFGHRYTVQDLLTSFPAPGAAVAGLLGAVQGVIGVLGTAVVIIVLPYYLLVELDSLREGFLKLFPADRRDWIERMVRVSTGKIGAWLNGQLLLSLTIGVTSSFGLWLLGVPYFYVLGVIAALGEFVPIIGPFVAAVPAVLVGWSVSPHTALFVIVWFSVQQFIEGNILVPRIMERQVGVSAWSVVVALVIGSELLGVAGAILAVPTAAIIQVFVREYLERQEK